MSVTHDNTVTRIRTRAFQVCLFPFKCDTTYTNAVVRSMKLSIYVYSG